MRHRMVHAPPCLNRAHVGGGNENLDEQTAERPSSDTVYSRRSVAGEPGWPSEAWVCHHVTRVQEQGAAGEEVAPTQQQGAKIFG